MKKLPVFAGATILGDGMVALILDIFGLGPIRPESSPKPAGKKKELSDSENRQGDRATRQSLLVFSLGAGRRYAPRTLERWTAGKISPKPA